MDSQNISKAYDAYYYAHECGGTYERSEAWLAFYAKIADRIVSEIGPPTVLDAGCGMGFLVEGLRERGVDADGVDFSEYVIQQVHSSIRDYCWVAAITEPFSREYDLIVCIEVLEHLPAPEAEVAIENLCRFTRDVLFSSTPFDYKEATHVNVRPPDFWAEKFAGHGFFRDPDFDATFITPWAVRFRKTSGSFARVVAGYERRLWQMEKENQGRRELALEQRNELAEKFNALQTQSRELAEKEESLQVYLRQNTEKEATIQSLEATLERRIQTERRLTNELSDQVRLTNELSAKSKLAAALSAELAHTRRAVDILTSQLAEKEYELARIHKSLGWRLLSLYGRRIKYPYLLGLYRIYGRFKYRHLLPIYRYLGLMPSGSSASHPSVSFVTSTKTVSRAAHDDESGSMHIEEIWPPPLEVHRRSVDIVVCVHNALEDTRRCLESVVRYTNAPYSLLLVDDGSDEDTREWLQQFALSQWAALIRNEQARGYTFAANQALKETGAEYVVLLNSDTVVTPYWLDRMVGCAESDSQIGLVGPLSNTASWQSVPQVFDGLDWAENKLPDGWKISDMAIALADSSGRVFPRIPFLNGFCLMIKRQAIEDIGYFDEALFGEGYGEENDYCLRAREAGWQVAVADDAYVFHAQSRSYSHERRKKLSERADQALGRKHDRRLINQGVEACRYERVLEGVRARARVLPARRELIEAGRSKWEGRRVAFILPVREPSGGASVVVAEAEAMRRMGVDARLVNLNVARKGFERAYPECGLPVSYARDESRIPELLTQYDAVIATLCSSVYWMQSDTQSGFIRGYYVQDFEPRFFAEGSEDFRIAWCSYTRYPDLVRITKTDWNRRVVESNIGVDCTVVGPSVDIDLYRPRSWQRPHWPQAPLKIAALIRPSTPRRNAALTMELLRDMSVRFDQAVEIITFGCQSNDPEFRTLSRDFSCRNAGVLTRSQLAFLLSEIDVFADFSAFQAMGLTALEAMACGVAVIGPREGGTESFIAHERNGLLIDTTSKESCVAQLERLISDDQLRVEIQRQALSDVCDYFPEKAAYRTLEAIFSSVPAKEK